LRVVDVVEANRIGQRVDRRLIASGQHMPTGARLRMDVASESFEFGGCGVARRIAPVEADSDERVLLADGEWQPIQAANQSLELERAQVLAVKIVKREDHWLGTEVGPQGDRLAILVGEAQGRWNLCTRPWSEGDCT